MNDDIYLSIHSPSSAEIRVKGSRFIAVASPVATEEQAENRIESIRRREHGATHHCTAYRVGADGDIFRYNDDGEPSGTAGAPILRQIDGRALTNTLVVVTRYFGGTKLGTGGLARAYGDAAGQVLESCKIARHVISERVNVSFDYDDMSPAMLTIERFGADVVESHYTEATEMTVAVPRSRVQAFIEEFTNALAGRGEVKVVDCR